MVRKWKRKTFALRFCQPASCANCRTQHDGLGLPLYVTCGWVHSCAAACVIACAAARLLEHQTCRKFVLLQVGRRTCHSILNMGVAEAQGCKSEFSLGTPPETYSRIRRCTMMPTARKGIAHCVLWHPAVPNSRMCIHPEKCSPSIARRFLCCGSLILRVGLL